MHVKPSLRKALKQRAGTTGMIEVNVRDDDVFDLRRIEAGLPNAGEQSLLSTRRSCLDQCSHITVRDEIRRYDTGRTAKMMIQQEYARLDLARETIGCWSVVDKIGHVRAGFAKGTVR